MEENKLKSLNEISAELKAAERYEKIHKIIQEGRKHRRMLKEEIKQYGFSEDTEENRIKVLQIKLQNRTEQAEGGDLGAMKEMYNRYRDGMGVAVDKEKAFGFIKKCAELGDLQSMYATALAYRSGEGVKKSEKFALEWLLKIDEKSRGLEKDRKLSKDDFEILMFSKRKIGIIYSEGIAVKQDFHTGIQYLTEAANYGDITAQLRLHLIYNAGIIPFKDDGKTFKFYQNLSDKENLAATYYVASCYEKGIDVEKDTDKAVELFAKIADRGYAEAQNHLGDLYKEGKLLAQDEGKAFGFYLDAAEQGLFYAQYEVGKTMLEWSKNEEDLKTAFFYIEKAAKNFDKRAMLVLGNCYLEGRGCKKDYIMGMSWIKNAAERGLEEAKKKIAQMHEMSKGILEFETDSPFEIRDAYIYIEESNISGIYYMTNSSAMLKSELKKYKLRFPMPSDFKPNPNLSKSVIEKMRKTHTCWSFENSNHGVLNFWLPEIDSIPYFCSVRKLAEKPEEYDKGIKDRSSQKQITIPLEVYKTLTGALSKYQDIQNQTVNFTKRVITSINLIQEYYGLKVSKTLEQHFGKSEDELKQCGIVVEKTDKFYDVLNKFRQRAGLEEVELYTKAGLSKQSFSNLRSGKTIPNKENIVSLALALKLNLSETKILLERAGHAFIPDTAFTKIITDALKQKIGNIDDVNQVLEKNGLEPLGAKIR